MQFFLERKIDENAVIPDYILHAIRFALSEPKREVLFNIVNYRLRIQESKRVSAAVRFEALNKALNGYLKGEVNFNDLRDMVNKTIPADSINDVLKVF